MENINKRQPRYWINPNFRLRFPLFSIEWHLCYHQDLLFECREDSLLRKTFRSKDTVATLIINETHSKVDILYSEKTDFQNLRLQKWFRENIKEQIIMRANNVLPHRLHELEQQKQLFSKGVSVKKLRKGVLGQCSHTNYISFSPMIVIFPLKMMDDVILHEMAHLKYHHHRKSFWRFLSELIGENSEQQKVVQDIALSKYWDFYTFLMK